MINKALKFGALCIVAGGVVIAAHFGLSKEEDFRQANFPCQEDEALMYAPVDHGNVVCVNVEEIE